MNQDDIIRMAMEVGLYSGNPRTPGTGNMIVRRLERFAALVAEHEREAVISLLKGIDKDMCEDPDGWWETSVGAEFGSNIIKAIRARGKE